MTTTQPKTFTTQFSKLGVFLLFVFSITLVVVSVANAIHYDSILNLSNGDDTQIGVRRGSLIWFYWLNVILAIVSSFATIYFFYRLFFKSNITESTGVEFLSNKLGSEAKGVDVYLLEKNCKELGIEGNAFKGDCQEYGTLDNDKKVDFYLEKSFNVDDAYKNRIKKNLCKNKSGSACNKTLNNSKNEVKELINKIREEENVYMKKRGNINEEAANAARVIIPAARCEKTFNEEVSKLNPNEAIYNFQVIAVKNNFNDPLDTNGNKCSYLCDESSVKDKLTYCN
jgi:hypothetical protein